MADLISTHLINKVNQKLNTAISELNAQIVNLENQLQSCGGYKKYTTNSIFVVPLGFTTIRVSAIGGGGGGGGGAVGLNNSSAASSASGGSGGGSGYYVYNREINVTPGETLTVIIGNGGSGGRESTMGTRGAEGTAGGSTLLKRGDITIFEAAGGGEGHGGYKPPNTSTTAEEPSGGVGGYNGKKGQWASGGSPYRRGPGGSGGKNPYFNGFGDGGDGGEGGCPDTTTSLSGKAGTSGKSGALLICFGNYFEASDITW